MFIQNQNNFNTRKVLKHETWLNLSVHVWDILVALLKGVFCETTAYMKTFPQYDEGAAGYHEEESHQAGRGKVKKC